MLNRFDPVIDAQSADDDSEFKIVTDVDAFIEELGSQGYDFTREGEKVFVIEQHGDKPEIPRYLTFEEARSVQDAVVIGEGDFGGQTYFTCPMKYVKCSEGILLQLLADIDDFQWEDPDGMSLSFNRVKPGYGVVGGMGGGIVVDGLWVHEAIDSSIATRIHQVLAGKIDSIQDAKWSSDNLAKEMLNRYSFGESLEWSEGNEAQVLSDITMHIRLLLENLHIALSSRETDSIIDRFLSEVPEGTDIDKEYGGSIVGVSSYIVRFSLIKTLEGFSPKVASKLTEIADRLSNNRGVRDDELFVDVRAIAELVSAFQAYDLGEPQILEALDLCDELAGEDKSDPVSFQKTTQIFKDGGLEALIAAREEMLQDNEEM